MKIALPICFLFFCAQVNAQNDIVGHYHDYSGSTFDFDSIARFSYTWHFDLVHSWSRGNWRISNDTIYLSVVPAYDTLTDITKGNQTIDSLILSRDTKPRRISMQEANYLYAGSQNFESCPRRLFYRKNRLYIIDDQGKVKKKWIKGFGRDAKKFPPYFIKTTTPQDK